MLCITLGHRLANSHPRHDRPLEHSLAYVSPWTGWVVLSASDMVKGNFLLRTTDAGRTWLKIAF